MALLSRLIQCSLTAGLLLISGANYAESGRADYDLDDDGLIEINDLADLDEIRNNLDGSSLYGESTGCPVGGCIGFELTTDLDFDTNGDGQMDASDDYWNDGEGWEPIRSSGSGLIKFNAVLNGNNHGIFNLYINRTGHVGLFSEMAGAEISQLELSGPLTFVASDSAAAILAHRAWDTIFSEIYIRGESRSEGGAALLAVLLEGESTIEGCAVSGIVHSERKYSPAVGLVVGRASLNTDIVACLSNGRLNDGGYTGGIVGRYGRVSASLGLAEVGNSRSPYYLGAIAGASATVKDSHWVSEYLPEKGAGSFSTLENSTAATLAELKCPTISDDSVCSTETLYPNWSDYTKADGTLWWDFGTSNQLPGVNILGRIVRDSDGDGVFDDQDAWPENPRIAIDSDADGYPDFYTFRCDAQCRAQEPLSMDYMPHHSEAYLDSDGDGLPEAWNPSCDSNCQLSSGLTLDVFPNDADNDGISDELDSDDNGDGKEDADADSDGLVDVSALAQLDAIRYGLSGLGRQLSEDAELDVSGCPVRIVHQPVSRVCAGYELTTDLDFDSNSDGILDANDIYWNGGKGWLPIGDESAPFTALFNGNNHSILNLFIDGQGKSVQGLFGYVKNAQLRHLQLKGPLTRVVDVAYYGGLLAGKISDSHVSEVFAQGILIGDKHLGLIAGESDNLILQGCAVAGEIVSSLRSANIGGAIGAGSDTTDITACISSVEMSTGAGFLGEGAGTIDGVLSLARVQGGDGLFSTLIYVDGTIKNSYWRNDYTSAPALRRGTKDGDSFGASLTELQCPVSADNESCLGATLYKGWASLMKPDGSVWWNFGTSGQLPGLNILGRIVRDNDGDGVFDDTDAWPDDPAIALDRDGDGYPDTYTDLCDKSCQADVVLALDYLPNNSAAHADTDADGLPDAWNPACDLACQHSSGLTLDVHPNDRDNDGVSDLLDNDDDNDGHIDADADSDGLIDITTLAQLDAVRYSLNGFGRRLSDTGELDSSGCPATLTFSGVQRVCRGYELLNDLDFDTNGDGEISELDAYWNDGRGWSGIGAGELFTAVFEGNNHIIANLHADSDALFDTLYGADIRRLEMLGAHVSANGRGLLASSIYSTKVSEIYLEGDVVGSVAGLIAGYVSDAQITGCAVAGRIRAMSLRDTSIGGLFGSSDDTTSITACISNVFIDAASSSGFTSKDANIFASLSLAKLFDTERSYNAALVASGGSITSSYWVREHTKLAGGSYQTPIESSYAASLAELQCPIAGDDLSCSDKPLYVNWANYTKADGSPWWNFGGADQLPGLNILGRTVRDSDGDGVFDLHDAWPLDPAIGLDVDADGYPDAFSWHCDKTCQAKVALPMDNFPLHKAAHADTDGDGMPDAWNTDCDLACQSESGLVLDAFVGDRDNDGITDLNDTDDNGDGFEDADADSDGLIEVASLAELNAIRFSLEGRGYRASEDGALDSSGCPLRLDGSDWVKQCIGYELVADLDFDTNSDGVIDASDDYWNGGEGWEPIGEMFDHFSAVFEGNNHVIANLMINRSSQDQGLFGYFRHGEINRLELSGPLTFVRGGHFSGLLASRLTNVNVREVYLSGELTGSTQIGLVAGKAYNSEIEGCVVDGVVKATSTFGYAGAVLGSGDESLTNISACLSLAHVESRYTSAGIAGLSLDSVDASLSLAALAGSGRYKRALIGEKGSSTNSYWLDLVSGGYAGGGILNHSYAVVLRALQCPDASDNSSCFSSPLYQQWSTHTKPDGSPWWDFGNNTQLPGLNILGRIIRDSDGDRALDSVDAFPFDYDNDGVDDQYDFYPLTSLAGAMDSDGDGIPNECASDCLMAGMLADTDNDNDGVINDDDAFPLDASESIDTDGDGIGNNADSDDDNDGVLDNDDAFPLDPDRSLDTDRDGIDNHIDTDDDNDGVDDYLDAFPLDASESVDSDNDGIGNNADTDDDNDGVLDGADAFPLNANESIDSDNDGFGNNEDVDDDNDMITDVWEEAYGFDPLDSADALLDADNDGASNLDEFESGTDPRDADSVPAWLQGGGAWKYYLYKKAAEGATLQ